MEHLDELGKFTYKRVQAVENFPETLQTVENPWID